MESIALHKKVSIYSLFLLTLLSILGFEYFAVQQAKFYEPNSFLPYAVGIDLLVIIPILYYFLIVKRLKQHIITLVFGVSLSVTVSYFILPSSHHFIIGYAEKLLIVLEILLVGYVLIKLKSIVGEYQRLNTIHDDFIGNLKKSFHSILEFRH
jgi:VIT1/CCC1 family predicted Fe2+/Mn2+ transporter